ncbi:MAG: TIGR01212 family radical SAM protein [Lachnospiraceae bacterium]|nr:TIGR01212 family radical SAM protein [Lachnospiraceae bacterium]
MMLGDYLRGRFGCKVYKISLSAGMTCPTLDGTVGTRGCIFCLNGSGEFAQEANMPVPEQIALAKQRIAKKVPPGTKYIAYFQSYTNTYGDLDRFEKIYGQAISDPEVVALSVGTRPDCVGDDVIEMLSRLNRRKPVWVELGLQTVHEETARYIRRGYELGVYDDAVRRLRNAGLETIVHVILGLPGESEDDMAETVRYVVNSGVDGIKLQLLHVLSGTDLAQDYASGKFEVMSLDGYVETLKKLLPLIPENVTIHRLTGDGPKRYLVAPLWSADKKAVINRLRKEGILR